MAGQQLRARARARRVANLRAVFADISWAAVVAALFLIAALVDAVWALVVRDALYETFAVCLAVVGVGFAVLAGRDT